MKKDFEKHQFRIAWGMAFTWIFVGTVIYHYIEKLNWVDSVYFSTITLTTVGYGDFSPETDSGKVFTVLYVIVGVGIIATFIDALGRRRVDKRMEKKKNG